MGKNPVTFNCIIINEDKLFFIGSIYQKFEQLPNNYFVSYMSLCKFECIKYADCQVRVHENYCIAHLLVFLLC